MGRPIKKEFIGTLESSYTNKVVITQALIPETQSPVTNVSIIKQTGTGRYIVTDGTNTGEVNLVDGSNGYVLKSGEATLEVSTDVKGEYTPSSITLNNPGSGYKESDTITIPSVGTFTVNAVSNVSGGTIQTIGIQSPVTTLYSTNMSSYTCSAKGGSGSSANVTLLQSTVPVYFPAKTTIGSNSGTGYKVNDKLVFTGYTTLTVSAVDANGVITSFSEVFDKTSDYYTTDKSKTNATPDTNSGSGTSAVFNLVNTSKTYYKIDGFKIGYGGLGYTKGDVLSVINTSMVNDDGTQDNYGTFEVGTTTPTTPKGGIVSGTVKLDTSTSNTDLSSKGVSGSGGSGSKATFDVTFSLEKIISYVRKLNNRTVVTFDNKVHTWSLDLTGEVDITTISK